MDSLKEKKKKYRDANDSYFEAILQLRGFSDDDTQIIADHIQDDGCKISKEIFQKGGVDFYLHSQKYIQKVSRWIKDRYNCIVNTTSTLHTRDVKANKDLYRLTVFVKLLPFNVGDIIDYKGEKVKISSIGKKPSGKIEGTGKRIFIDFDQIQYN